MNARRMSNYFFSLSTQKHFSFALFLFCSFSPSRFEKFFFLFRKENDFLSMQEMAYLAIPFKHCDAEHEQWVIIIKKAQNSAESNCFLLKCEKYLKVKKSLGMNTDIRTQGSVVTNWNEMDEKLQKWWAVVSYHTRCTMCTYTTFNQQKQFSSLILVEYLKRKWMEKFHSINTQHSAPYAIRKGYYQAPITEEHWKNAVDDDRKMKANVWKAVNECLCDYE